MLGDLSMNPGRRVYEPEGFSDKAVERSRLPRQNF